MSKHYPLSKFDSPDRPGSGAQMSPDLIAKLDALVDLLEWKPNINSAYRTAEHNKAVKGSLNSAHLRGHAVDLQAMSGRARYEIVEAALKVGFTRIGVAQTFIHLDTDPSLPARVVWRY